MLLLALLAAVGCDSTTSGNEQDIEVVGIEITPEDHSIVKGEEKQFTALAVLARGDKVPFHELDRSIWTWEWSVTNPQITIFDNTGLATGLEVGETMCWVTLQNSAGEASEGSASGNGAALVEVPAGSGLPRLHKPFVGRDSFGVKVISPEKLKAKFNLH
ncbi:hypothetical protein SAMN06265218_101312 [Fodinibius sediminis]|uniref:Ig-like domain (Group 2) n=2 Tax=Fodinibius sediminis TaxID=1214077 RepID=A0A521ARK8_9BACT|nr:hypothetical protein SAMN06265218_101312 [Fodinibius sediminis]